MAVSLVALKVMFVWDLGNSIIRTKIFLVIIILLQTKGRLIATIMDPLSAVLRLLPTLKLAKMHAILTPNVNTLCMIK